MSGLSKCKEIRFSIDELREQRAMIHRALLVHEKQRHKSRSDSQATINHASSMQRKLAVKRELLAELDAEILDCQQAYEKIVAAGGSLLEALCRQEEVDATMEVTTYWRGQKGHQAYSITTSSCQSAGSSAADANERPHFEALRTRPLNATLF